MYSRLLLQASFIHSLLCIDCNPNTQFCQCATWKLHLSDVSFCEFYGSTEFFLSPCHHSHFFLAAYAEWIKELHMAWNCTPHSSLLTYLCLCVYVVCGIHAYATQRTTSGIIPQVQSIFFETGWLPSKSPKPTCLLLCTTGTASVCHQACLLYHGSQKLNTDPSACKTSALLIELSSNYFLIWVSTWHIRESLNSLTDYPQWSLWWFPDSSSAGFRYGILGLPGALKRTLPSWMGFLSLGRRL